MKRARLAVAGLPGSLPERIVMTIKTRLAPGRNGVARSGSTDGDFMPDDHELFAVAEQSIADAKVKTALSDAIRKALARPKTDEPPEMEPPAAPAPDYLKDTRALAKTLGFLQHDSPERAALLRAAGLDADALSSRCCASLGENLLKEVDNVQAGDTMPWSRFAHPDRDSEPRTSGINAIRLSTVVPREVDWLWHQRIPRGKLTLISGDPDLGKTWVVLDVIARITTGRALPDSSPNPFGERRNALWVSAEDEDDDTVLPRLQMLKGDASRVESFRFVLTNGVEHSLDLSRHLDDLDAWLTERPLVALVALDPLPAFLGKVDSHRNADVRQLLTPLVKLASKHNVAIIGVNHLHKGESDNAMYKGMGSIAFVAAARSSWLVTKDAKEPKDRRLFTKVKGNVASEDVGGLAFRVGKAHNGLLWEKGKIDVSADEALAKPNQAPAQAEAMDFLRALLAKGPVPAGVVKAQAKDAGISDNTLDRARAKLGVQKKSSDGARDWTWQLPPAPRDGVSDPPGGVGGSGVAGACTPVSAPTPSTTPTPSGDLGAGGSPAEKPAAGARLLRKPRKPKAAPKGGRGV